MKYKTLDDFNFKGKRVLLRSDLNSPVKKGKVIFNERIIESARTIKELQKKRARVVIIAHQGRKGDRDFTSLKQHSVLLGKFVKVKFVDDILGKKALDAIEELKNGETILLENIRYLDEEMKPEKDNKIVKVLAPHFDIYVNDAFSVSHRAQTSIVSFPSLLPSAIGRLMQHELESLEKIKIKDSLFVLGGKKIEEQLLFLNRKKIISGGTLGQLILISRGHNLGLQNKLLKNEMKYLLRLKKHKKILAPVDYAFLVNGKRKEFSLDEMPVNYEVMDIGRKTMEIYRGEIMKAKIILMKGPVGYCEDKKFRKGTAALLKAVASSRAFSVLGGGHLTTVMRDIGLSQKNFDYVSLSGGAFDEYLAGKKLPGLEVLKMQK